MEYPVEGFSIPNFIEPVCSKIPPLTGTKNSTSPTISNRDSSGRINSRIPVRIYTHKVVEPINGQSKGNPKKSQNEKCQDGSSKAKGKISKSVSLQEENNTKDMITTKTHSKTLAPKSGQKEEGNTKLNALARRRAYEAKRKSELVVATNAKSKVNVKMKKSEKIPSIKLKTNSTGKSTMNTEVNDTKNASVQSPLPWNSAIGKVSKRASTINKEGNATGEKSKELSIELANDNFKYDDDFDPIDEDKIAQIGSGEDSLQKLVAINSSETRFSKVQEESIPNNGHVFVTGIQRLEKPDTIPLHSLQTPKKIIYECVPWVPAFERPQVQTEGDAPNTTRSDVEIDKDSKTVIKLYYNPSHCFKHMQPAIAHVYENLNRIPEYREMKKEIRKKLRREKSQTSKKKVTASYVPGYGTVRRMEKHMDQICPVEKSQNSHVISCQDVTEKRCRPSRSPRVNVGYVPGYGPIRRAPIKGKPDGPAEKVVLPAINPSRSCNPHGDVSENKRSSCGQKRRVDVLESRARAQPFNTYIDEEASRRFERQYTRRQCYI